jgi:carbapenam-3-carboxylate synthase
MMSSFIVMPSTHRDALASVAERAGWGAPPIELGAYMVAHSGAAEDRSGTAATARDRGVVFAGEIQNREAVRSLLALYDSAALVAEDAQLVSIALAQIGDSAIAWLEGAFACIALEPAGRLRVFGDVTGQMPVYVTREPTVCVASGIKYICLRDDFRPQFAPVGAVVETAARPDDFCPLLNVQRLKPGACMTLSLDGGGGVVRELRLVHQFRPAADRGVALGDARGVVRNLLESVVRSCAQGAGRVAVPLSGGIDSSLVTALAARSVAPLGTFSVGTERSNEFAFAEIVARHVGTQHRTFVLSDQDILRGLVDAIYHNELYDGYAAEVQAPLLALYRRVPGDADTLLTGYGADLLFGGTVPHQAPTRAVNEALWHQVYRTRWSGEFSPAGARAFGLCVRHPFWSNRLMAFCLDLDPALKVSTQEIKIVLRGVADHDNLLPKQIITRKKLGVHEGSAVDRIFADMVEATPGRFEQKTRFSYFVYRQLMEQRVAAKDIDLNTILGAFRAHEARG